MLVLSLFFICDPKKRESTKEKRKDAIVYNALRAWIEWKLSAEADTLTSPTVAAQHGLGSKYLFRTRANVVCDRVRESAGLPA